MPSLDIAETHQTHTGVDSDMLLQASRRLDWRFLLPDPTLGRVAYVGQAQDGLIASLQLLADQLDIRNDTAPRHSSSAPQEAVDDAVDCAAYDVVVAHAPSYAALQKAAALAGRTGYLYVEARGLLAATPRLATFRLRAHSPRLWSLTRYVHALRQCGMQHITAFWLWPTHETCTKIVPVNDVATVVRFQMAHRQNLLLRRLIDSRVAKALTESRLVHDAIPHFGIVAYRANRKDGDQKVER